ncbi:MAG: DUF929 family protein [Acidimicrobiales bacterium]
MASGIAGLVIVAVVVALVIVKVTGGSSPGSAKPGGQPNAGVVEAATSVPQSVLNKVGVGGSQASTISPPMKIKPGAPALTAGGKPLIVYEGAEYCPYCATERWGMVVALSKLGTFSHLQTTKSSSTDVFPDTPTFTFYKAQYSSPYVTFQADEQQTRTGAVLQAPTAQQTLLYNTYEVQPYLAKGEQPGIPFVDIGNRYLVIGPSYPPYLLHTSTSQQAPPLPIGTVAGSLSLPTTPIAQGVDATANYFLAAMCSLMQGKTPAVCNASGTQRAAAVLQAEKAP